MPDTGVGTSEFSNFGQNSFDYDSLTSPVGLYTLNFFISASIIPGQEYLISFDINQNAGSGKAELSPTSLINDQDGTQLRISSSFNRKLLNVNGNTLANPNNPIGTTFAGTRDISASFTGANFNPVINYSVLK